jgi:hypothetical protein
MLVIVGTGVDFSNSTHYIFALSQFFLFGLPTGALFGVVVFAVVTLVRVATRRRLGATLAAATYGFTAFLTSGALMLALTSLFPFTFSEPLMVSATAVAFGAAYFLVARGAWSFSSPRAQKR